MFRSLILPALLLASSTYAASAKDWSTKSVYQLVTDRFATSNDSSTTCDTTKRTYCGGSWAGIANHLDYIQSMGFDAVWISPIVKNADATAYGDGYHGYWPLDNNRLSESFGTPADLKALSAALHARGMYLMLDVVINHYAGVPTHTSRASLSVDLTFDFASFQPLDSEMDFHPQCFITDYTNQTDVEQCWLGDSKLPLPDIDTEDPAIVATINKWIKDTVTAYSIDGVRIDTVKHIRRDFWKGFAASAGVFALGEVLTDNATYAASYLDVLDAVLDYPAWYDLNTAFASTSGNLSALESSPALTSLSSAPGALTAAFLENHDQPRFPSYTSDGALKKNAMVWPFVGNGMPILYYGQEQGYGGGADPWNREALWLSGFETNKPLVAHVRSLNAARKLAIAANDSFLSGAARWIPQSDPSTIMMSKPPLLTLLTNIGANATRQPTWTIPAGLYAANVTLVDVLACAPLVVGGAGEATVVRATWGLPQVLIPAHLLNSRGGACPALAGAGSSGAPPGRVRRGLAMLGAVLGVAALV